MDCAVGTLLGKGLDRDEGRGREGRRGNVPATGRASRERPLKLCAIGAKRAKRGVGGSLGVRCEWAKCRSRRSVQGGVHIELRWRGIEGSDALVFPCSALPQGNSHFIPASQRPSPSNDASGPRPAPKRDRLASPTELPRTNRPSFAARGSATSPWCFESGSDWTRGPCEVGMGVASR